MRGRENHALRQKYINCFSALRATFYVETIYRVSWMQMHKAIDEVRMKMKPDETCNIWRFLGKDSCLLEFEEGNLGMGWRLFLHSSTW